MDAQEQVSRRKAHNSRRRAVHILLSSLSAFLCVLLPQTTGILCQLPLRRFCRRCHSRAPVHTVRRGGLLGGRRTREDRARHAVSWDKQCDGAEVL
jgi:hypothetical protein